jgi:hypothetical protein
VGCAVACVGEEEDGRALVGAWMTAWRTARKSVEEARRRAATTTRRDKAETKTHTGSTAEHGEHDCYISWATFSLIDVE